MADASSQSRSDDIEMSTWVDVREHDGITAELRNTTHGDRYSPPHFHDAYQVIIGTHTLIEFRCRGTLERSPIGSLFVVPPGEVHSAEVLDNRSISEPLRAFLIPSAVIEKGLAETGTSHNVTSPRSALISHRNTFSLMLNLHRSIYCESTDLERDVLLLRAVRALQIPVENRARCGRRVASARVSWVRDFIHQNHFRAIRLQELSNLADLSPFYLVREFRREYGLPPHAYQIQIRVIRARELLLRGHSAVEVALRTGFADQAHLSRVFKRLMGVSPSHYGSRKARTFKPE